MPYFTTGLLDNALVEGVGQSPTISVNISNGDISTVAVQIEGFSNNGVTKEKYVEEFFTLSAGAVVMKNYYIPFNAFEFMFFISSQSVEVTLCSKDVNGTLSSVPLVAVDANN